MLKMRRFLHLKARNWKNRSNLPRLTWRHWNCAICLDAYVYGKVGLFPVASRFLCVQCEVYLHRTAVTADNRVYGVFAWSGGNYRFDYWCRFTGCNSWNLLVEHECNAVIVEVGPLFCRKICLA